MPSAASWTKRCRLTERWSGWAGDWLMMAERSLPAAAQCRSLGCMKTGVANLLAAISFVATLVTACVPAAAENIKA